MDSRKKIILLVACTAVLFEALDIAIINLAMPLVRADFGLDNSTVQWLQTVYILSYGGFMIVGGKLADLAGRKKIFMIGAALFLTTSLGAALSFTFEQLMMFRLVQGIGAAFVMPSALSIITHTFEEGPARSKAIGIFSAFAAIGSGTGLSVGGIIATYSGWQGVFFINVPVIAITLCIGYIYIPADARVQQKNRADIFSAVILTLGIMLLSYFVHELMHFGDYPVMMTAMLLCIIAAMYIFISRNQKRKDPLIDFSIFRSALPLQGNIASVFLGAFFTSYLFILSLVLQQNMQYDTATAGLLLLPFSILSVMVGKFLIPVLVRKMPVQQSSLLGMSTMLLGGILLIVVLTTGYPLIILLLSVACVTGIGIAVTYTSLTVMAMHGIPQQHHGLASSVATTAYFFGGGLGLSILGPFLELSVSEGSINILPAICLTLFAAAGVMYLLLNKRAVAIAA
ncbi:MFS transporter [Ohtaekwangia kribbensis]|uniref:MFS transporter n=1 Tax=Ohtaekwangia kribbensis TaxID=688913 RepID=A0ABW3K0C6_9BACT